MILSYEKMWVGIGLLGQGVFTARFLVQWFASERKRETVVPVAFWWLSLGGGLITLTYAIHLQSLAFTLGQSMGLFVYIRNLMLHDKARRRSERRRRRAELQQAAHAVTVPVPPPPPPPPPPSAPSPAPSPLLTGPHAGNGKPSRQERHA